MHVVRFFEGLGFNLMTLHDKAATRDGIFHALNTHLLWNTGINRGDPVVIYFAGHGASYPASHFGTDDTRRVEAILPVDRGQNGKDGIISDIHDFELEKFLRELNAERTGNITVILDSCHSGGATRQVNQLRRNKPDLLPVIHPEIIDIYNSERNSLLQSEIDESTHICIAACRDYEYAWENYGGGMFTKLLLRLLQSLPMSSTTYAQLEESLLSQLSIELSRQHPVIYGSAKQSLLFRIGSDNTSMLIKVSGLGYNDSAGSV
jgi:hypothetical protein